MKKQLPAGRRLWWAAGLLLLAGCTRGPAAEPHFVVSGADASRGRAAIRSYGCGSCHMIPGVRDAQGTVGPPLLAWGRRTFIAGEAPNTPDQLVRWIRTPQAIEPGTAMPNLGVNDQDARDIAAYLYTLR